MMTTIELRNKVYKKLESVDDYLLEEILGLIELDDIKKEILKIPNEHKKDIEIGLKQIEGGQTVTNQEVNNRVQQWLEK